MEFKSNAQLKAFLKKEAKRLNISVGAAYSTYFSRLLLERLAAINNGELVVKGSFSQFVHLRRLTRPVLDIDLSSTLEHNTPLLTLYQSLYDAADKNITFDMESHPKITKNGVYKLPVYAKVLYNDEKPIIQPINVDFKEKNKIIFDTDYKEVLPIFEGDHSFYINTPSFEEHIAEKLFIIAHNRRDDVLNTRVKDFYDIYELHGGAYDPKKFSIYFLTMLYLYGENVNELSTDYLSRDFVNKHTELWYKMRNKYEFIDKSLEFEEAVFYTRAVLREQLQRINSFEVQNEAQKLALKLS